MAEQTEQNGQQYPGAVSAWRELTTQLDEALADPKLSAEARAIALAIRCGFEGITFVATQMRFDANSS